MSSPNILVVDDEPDIRDLVQEILEDEGYDVRSAENGASARLALRERKPDLILLDIWMPDVDGVTLLREWGEQGSLSCPVVMMSGHATVETAVEATRLGAYDFVEKPLSLAKLLVTVERSLEADKLARENAGLKRSQDTEAEPLGKSEAVRELRERAKRIAGHDSWILITGEAGTGKKMWARYIHQISPRKDGPFIQVAAGTLPGENSAVELFGSEDGEKVVYGHLEQANGGTLFIDEVADLDLQAQTRLVSALHNRSFHRVGGEQPVEVDVRIIAVTRLPLEQEVRAGRFREDLFYHLNVVPFRIPPLRDHREDVPDLLNYYVDRLVEGDHLNYRRFSTAAQNRLRNHSWPGNVRELKNLVHRLLILGKGGDIDVNEVEAALGASADSVPLPVTKVESGINVPLELSLRDAREEFERLYLLEQLKRAQGSVVQLAKLSGMERTHLYRKLKALGIDPKDMK